MFQRKTFTSLALIMSLAATPAVAQQQEEHQQHPPPGPSSSAMSQRGPGMTGGGMPMTNMMRMGMGREEMDSMGMMADHVEGRLAFLKTELKITQAQLPLWNAVADAMRANAKSMSGMMSGGMMGTAEPATLPERLALREKMMTVHLEALGRFKPAIDPLYAALSREQKKTADQRLMGPMGMM